MTNYEPSLSSIHIELSNNYFLDNSLSSKSTKVNDALNSIMINDSLSYNSNVDSVTSTSMKLELSQVVSSISSEIFDKNIEQYSSVDSNSLISNDETNKIFSFLKKFHYLSITEDQTIHNRPNFQSKVDEIYAIYPEYEFLTLKDITDNSYFSILWTPIKSTHNFANNTSFLVFYRFRNRYLSNAVKYVPVIGLLSNKLDEEFWLTNTNLNYNPNVMTESNFNMIIEDYNKNKYRYSQVIVYKFYIFSHFVINL